MLSTAPHTPIFCIWRILDNHIKHVDLCCVIGDAARRCIQRSGAPLLDSLQQCLHWHTQARGGQGGRRQLLAQLHAQHFHSSMLLIVAYRSDIKDTQTAGLAPRSLRFHYVKFMQTCCTFSNSFLCSVILLFICQIVFGDSLQYMLRPQFYYSEASLYDHPIKRYLERNKFPHRIGVFLTSS